MRYLNLILRHPNGSFAIAPSIITTTHGLVDIWLVIIINAKAGVRSAYEHFLSLINSAFPYLRTLIPSAV